MLVLKAVCCFRWPCAYVFLFRQKMKRDTTFYDRKNQVWHFINRQTNQRRTFTSCFGVGLENSLFESVPRVSNSQLTFIHCGYKLPILFSADFPAVNGYQIGWCHCFTKFKRNFLLLLMNSFKVTNTVFACSHWFSLNRDKYAQGQRKPQKPVLQAPVVLRVVSTIHRPLSEMAAYLLFNN